MADLRAHRHIVLADDDTDDVLLFQDAIEQLLVHVQVTTVENGVQLMNFLNEIQTLPDLLFLDLNMPLKSGKDCLSAIKQSKKLQSLPVIIFSTSIETAAINQLYEKGAQFYIGKPNDFVALKNVIQQALHLTAYGHLPQPARDHFVLSPESFTHDSK